MDDISGKHNKIRSEVVNRDILTTKDATLIENKLKIEDIAPSKVRYAYTLIVNAIISIISFITPLKLRFKTSPVIDASNMGNGFYLPCPLNKHIKSIRSSRQDLAKNRINYVNLIPDIGAMNSDQLKRMVANIFEKSYELAKPNNKENFGIVINVPGNSTYPIPLDNQLPYDEFIKLLYTEAHNQLNLFQVLDSSINFQLYVNFPKETDSTQTNLAINQANTSYDSIPNDVYVSDIKQYIKSYQTICERSVSKTEGHNIVSNSHIDVGYMLLQDTINRANSGTAENVYVEENSEFYDALEENIEFYDALEENSGFYDTLEEPAKQLLIDLQQEKLHADKFSDTEIFDKYIRLFYLAPNLQTCFEERQLENGNYELKLGYYFSVTIKNQEIINFLSADMEDKMDMLITSIALQRVTKPNYQPEIKIKTFFDFLGMMKVKDQLLNTGHTNNYSFNQLINQGGILAFMLPNSSCCMIDSARCFVENEYFVVNLNNRMPILSNKHVKKYEEISNRRLSKNNMQISSLLLEHAVITIDELNRFNITINNDVLTYLLDNLEGKSMLQIAQIMNLVDSKINLPFSVFRELFSTANSYSVIKPRHFENYLSQDKKCAFVLALSKFFSHIDFNQYDNLIRKDEIIFIYAFFINIKNILTVKLPAKQQLEVNSIMLDTLILVLTKIKNINDCKFLDLVKDSLIIELIDKLGYIISNEDNNDLDEKLCRDNSFIILLVYYAEHCNRLNIRDKTRALYKKYISSEKYNSLKKSKDFTSVFGNMDDGDIDFDVPEYLNYMFKKEEKTILLSDKMIADLLSYQQQNDLISLKKTSMFIGEEQIPTEQLPIADIFTKDLLIFKSLYEELNSGATKFIGLILDLTDQQYRDDFIAALNNPYGASKKIDLNDKLSSFAKYLTDDLRSLTAEHFSFLKQHLNITDKSSSHIARLFVVFGCVIVKLASKGALGTEYTSPELLRLYAAALFDKAYELDRSCLPVDFHDGKYNSWSMKLRGEMALDLCGDYVFTIAYNFLNRKDKIKEYKYFLDNFMPVNWR